MIRNLLLASALLCVAADDPPAKDKKFPTDQHKKLDGLVGTWDVAINFKAGDRYIDGKANCEAKWELDGMVLRQKYDSSMNGKPYTVIQILGYDTDRKKCFEIMLDNLHSRVNHNEGEWSADGKTLTHWGEHYDATGKKQKLRTVYTWTDPDQYTIEWFMSKPEGGEDRGVTLKHTRKK